VFTAGHVNVHQLLEDVSKKRTDRFPPLWGALDDPITDFKQVSHKIMQK